MSNIIMAMGATHTEHDKLLGIVDLTGKHVVPNQTRLEIMASERTRYGDNIQFNYPCAWVAEEKIDGYSYVANNGALMSRKLSEAKETKGQPTFKTDHVPHIAIALDMVSNYYDADFHGELYKPGGTSDDVTRIMGCTADKAIFRQTNECDKLHYMVHDIRRFNGRSLINEPWYVRRAILEMIFGSPVAEMAFSQYIELSEVILDPRSAFTRIVSEGGEGLMFKNTNGLYVPDKKPANNWVKCKKEVTLDVVITGFNNDGSGKNKDLFKSMTVGIYDGGGALHDVGSIHSGISDELRRRMHNNRDEFIGKVIEVDAMEFNGKSYSLRHGRLVRFRHDKLPTQCTADGLRIKYDI